MNSGLSSRRFKHGAISTVLTVFVIAAVILFNSVFSALAAKFMWYTDLTPEEIYTLSDSAIEAVKEIKTDVTVLFCDDPDNLAENDYLFYVYNTARNLAELNANIHVETVNILRNPTAVNRFKTTSKSNIYTTNIIVYSGTEYRIYSYEAMYGYNDTSTTPWTYNGENKLITGMLAVTMAKAPIACVTNNHGEPFTTKEALLATPLGNLLYDAGYEVQLLNLATEEIPADCRMLVVYDPQEDFLVRDNISEVSEIEKLDKFLDGANALMLFVDPTTPVLPHFEEYLVEWGIEFDRFKAPDGLVSGTTVKEPLENSLTGDGFSVVAKYAEMGVGASMHSVLRKNEVYPLAVFRNVMPINFTYDPVRFGTVEDDPSYDKYKNYIYGSYEANGISRSIYNVFTSSENASVVVGGNEVGYANSNSLYNLMTVTRESHGVGDSFEHTHVIACGSTEFLSPEVIYNNAYANSDVMLGAFRSMGHELVVVDIDHKPFASLEISSITAATANRYTAVLIVIPAVFALGCGIFVLVRRKNA